MGGMGRKGFRYADQEEGTGPHVHRRNATVPCCMRSAFLPSQREDVAGGSSLSACCLPHQDQ